MTRVRAGDVSVDGIEDVRKLLEKQVPKQANNIMKATIRAVAAQITKEAKNNLGDSTLTGNLKKAIKTKARKSAPDRPIVDVIVTQGKAVANDGFYWRFIEFGTGGGKGSHLAKNYQANAKPFLQPAKDKVFSELPRILEQQFTKKIQAATKRQQKKNRAKVNK